MAMKWLRKHNKKILVVGGAMLMLAFLMPQQRGCGRGRRMKDREVAQAFGHKIMLSEYYRGRSEHQLLRDIGLGIPVADPLDYVLLLREARQMHIPAGAEVVPEELATAIAQRNKVNNLAELAAKLSEQQKSGGYRITEKMLRRAIGNFWSIVQTQQLVLGKPTEIEQGQGRRVRDFRSTLGLAQPSEKELELIFRNRREMLDVEYVTLPAWRYASRVQPASEAEIIAQFETYKDQYPGTTDNEFGFGYKQPILIQIEYIKADIKKIMAGLEEPAPAVLAEYYEKNKQAYALPTQDKADKQNESVSEEGQNTEPVKQYKPFEEVYEALKNNWLKEKARETALSMMAKARSLSGQRWDELKKEQKETSLNLAKLYPYAGDQGESLVGELAKEFKVVPNYKRTGWLDPSQAERLAGIGRSYADGQQLVGFMALAFSARQSSPYQEDRAGDRPEGFEIGQDSPISLLDAQGNAYLFRVIGLQTEKILSVEEMLENKKVRSRVT
ncbi:MAG: hypothetical protein GWP14_07845, partial [Actinobacteria bacterium]|nr:hypothetical protein [Actinomycetota bacterium]